jgi:hypothetical protein
MPWQLEALRGQLATDRAGELLHRHSLVSVARQNGKTAAIGALVGWWLTERARERGPQHILSTAHRLDLASLLFHAITPSLEELGAKVIRSYGRERATMPDGSTWNVSAATANSGHGRTLDLVVVDELWDIAPSVIDHSLLPTMRTRRSPLLSMWSTAGTEASTALLAWRERGIATLDKPSGLWFAEWSPAPSVDPYSRSAWRAANPALGHTLSEEVIAIESRGDRAAFLRESVNLWIATDRAWLPGEAWTRLTVRDLELPDGGVIAVESSLDDSRFVALRAVVLPSLAVGVEVVLVATRLEELWAALGAIADRDRAVKFVVGASLEAALPLTLARRAQLAGYKELLRLTSLARTMILEGRVQHRGETLLDEHVCRAVAIRHEGALALSSKRSPGPTELARCLVSAVGIAARPRDTRRAALAVARRR